MASTTNIEWTEQTWNPITGCSKISLGCANCYAEVMARRLKAMNTPGYENGFTLTLHHKRLNEPFKRKKKTIFFVNSMSDLFHKNVPISFINEVFSVIEKTPQHTYQILTKRAKRMYEYFKNRPYLKNVWLGVSIEDKSSMKNRLEYLRQIKIGIRFISFEPLLEDIGEVCLDNIHWVIVGGESGSKARPMKQEWVESIKNQCNQSRVAFFFKQWGGWGADGKKRSKKVNGRELNGIIWNQMP